MGNFELVAHEYWYIVVNRDFVFNIRILSFREDLKWEKNEILKQKKRKEVKKLMTNTKHEIETCTFVTFILKSFQ